LQVKTSGKKKKTQQWWPVSVTSGCLRGSNAYYVFVRYDQLNERFEAFMENADTVMKTVDKYVKDEKVLGNSGMPFWGLPDTDAERKKLADNWENWYPRV
jgi:hypothetical protein